MRGYVGVGGEVIVPIDDLSPVVLDDGRERMSGGCCGMPIFFKNVLMVVWIVSGSMIRSPLESTM